MSSISSADEPADRHGADGRDLPTLTSPPSPIDPDATTDELPETRELPATRALPGDVVAPPGYELVRELGRGGMGIVFLATQLTLNRPAALKMVLGAGDQRQFMRFLVEAEALAMVRHPHVVQVYECGEYGGRPFLSMEYLAGGTLAERLERSGPLPPKAAAELARTLARGIEAAHRQGVVHRDLKPGNILYDAAGEPRVTDFGLAKRGIGQDLTATESTMGTPAYMAPEQARGESKYAGPPADVYALGVILYECLTGTRPFDGAHPLLVLHQVANAAPPPPSMRIGGVPHDLEVICLKCLRKEPERRYPSAGDLAADLERYLKGEPILARPVGRGERTLKWVRRHPTRTALAAFLILVLGAAAAAVALHQRRLDETRARTLVAHLETAPAAELPRLRQELRGLRIHAEPLVRALAEQHRSGDGPQGLNASLILAEWVPTEMDRLVDRALTATPEEILAIRDMFGGQHRETRARLAAIIHDRSAARPARLRAQALIAAKDAPIAEAVAEELAKQLLVEDRLQLAAWVRAFEPVKASLVDAVGRRYIQGSDTEAGIGAAMILREYLKGDAARVVPLLEKGGPRQAFLVAAALRDSPDARTILDAEWARRTLEAPKHLDMFNPEDQYDADARRRARIGLAMLASGHAEPVWHALAMSADPRLRTYLVHLFAQAGVDPQSLRPALALGDASIRQALYLAWSEYASDVWSTGELEQALAQVADDYAKHPDPGVHSAAERLLLRWTSAAHVKDLAARLPAAQSRGARRWFTNGQGMTFAIVPGPVDVNLGTYWHEWGWSSPESFFGSERVQQRRIGRTFALATRELTYDLVSRFQRECAEYLPKDKSFGMTWSSRTGDSPAVSMDWYDAVKFCRWLSEKEGVPESEQCYPPLPEIKPGMKLAPDYLRRMGYRLPTEAEWEHACRAGSRTPFSYGWDPDLLGRYCWYEPNAGRSAHPVGQLLPNPLGLFDVHGNVFEWCSVRADVRPEADRIRDIQDDAGADAPCNPDDLCVLRGGDFAQPMQRMRSAHRTVVKRTFSWPASGLRVARTIAAPTLDVFCADADGSRARFEVRGLAGGFRVSDVKGNVTLEQREGTIPGSFHVAAVERKPTPFRIEVQRLDSPGRVRIADMLLPIEWRVRWHAWKPDPIQLTMPPTEAAWAEALRKPLSESVAPSLTVSWRGKHPLASVPAEYCGMVADADVELPAGAYHFALTGWGSGSRMFLDGARLLEHNWSSRFNIQEASRTLAAGKHSLRVEYYALPGPAAFDFKIQRVNETGAFTLPE